MNKCHYFNDEYRQGQKGEIELCKVFKQVIGKKDAYIERLGGRNEPDLRVIFKKKNLITTIECKTDKYLYSKTDNFFIERYSDDEKMTPGGPWQTDSPFFVYYFENEKEVHIFNTEELRMEMEKMEPDLPGHRISRVRNKTYYTLGYMITRTWLDDILLVRFKTNQIEKEISEKIYTYLEKAAVPCESL